MIKKGEVLIRISEESKKALDDLKVHPRETYADIVQRLLERVMEEGRLLDGATR
jgi:DNA integrity scanning protein DisA with diadenylate cyclase activity